MPWRGGVHRPPLLSLSANDLVSKDVEEADGKGGEAQKALEVEVELPPGIEPLVLWDPEEDPAHAVEGSVPIMMDPILTKFLRPHQR